MTKAQHTQGPWKVGAITSKGNNIQIRAQKLNTEFEICPAVLGGWGTSVEENKYNAHLIAAAPDLLAALEQAITSMQDSGYSNDHVSVKSARAAIAKAKGQQ